MLGGKILEIFYEEFIKFVPAYILRREEERKKQQEQELENTKDVGVRKGLQKQATLKTSVLPNSPTGAIAPSTSSIVAKQAKLIQH